MIVVFGQRLCGQVDRVPGLCYVSTKFLHIQYMPLIPVGSYLVKDGSESGNGFQGFRIPLSLKSVLAGYSRTWLALATCVAALYLTWRSTTMYVQDNKQGIVWLVSTAAVVGLLWFLLIPGSRRRWYLSSQMVLLLASLGWCSFEPRVREDELLCLMLFIANAAGLIYTMTRWLTPVSPRRAMELGRLLGIPPVYDDACMECTSARYSG